MSGAGWFDDPTGRFGTRWFDGSNWTPSVVGASGAVVSDPVPERDVPYPPPADTPRAAPTAPATGHAPHAPDGPVPAGPPQGYYPAQGHPPPGYAAYGPTPRARGRYLPGPGLGVGAVGLLCVALSLFALDWGKGSRAGFLDLSKAVRKAGSSSVDDAGIYYYCAWAGFVLLGVTVVLVILAGVPLPPTAAGNTYARIAGAVVAGGAAVLQTVAVAEVFKGPASPQFGAWLGVLGYLVVVGGFVLGARRAR